MWQPLAPRTSAGEHKSMASIGILDRAAHRRWGMDQAAICSSLDTGMASAQDRTLRTVYEINAVCSKCFGWCGRNLHYELRHCDVFEVRKRCHHREPPQFSSRVY